MPDEPNAGPDAAPPDAAPPADDTPASSKPPRKPQRIKYERALAVALEKPERMRAFCRIALPKGQETAPGRYDISAYTEDGFYVRLTPGLGKIGDVVNAKDGHKTTSNVMTLLRVLAEQDARVPPPVKALRRFMRLLETPAAWLQEDDAEAGGIWAHDVELDLSDNFIIEGWIYRDSTTVAYGQRSSYKSFWALFSTLTAAYGLPKWFGRDVIQTGVVYVAAEGGEGVKKRIRAFQIHHGIDPKTPVPFLLIPRQVNLGDPSEVSWLINSIKKAQQTFDIGLLVLDTLARSMRGLNENSAMDVAIFLDGVEQVRRATGVGGLIIAHAGKDVEAGARGSSLIEADTDAVIRLLRAKDQEDRTVTATVTKLKDEKDGDTLTFAFESITLGKSPTGRPKTSGVIVEAVGTEAQAEIRLKPEAQVLLDALRECVINQREEFKIRPPGVPTSNAPITQMKRVRAEFAKRRGFPAKWTTKHTERFEKAMTQLLDNRMMAMYGEYVWLHRAAEAAPVDPQVRFPSREGFFLKDLDEVEVEDEEEGDI